LTLFRPQVSTLKLIFFHTLVLGQRIGILGVLIVCAIPGLEFGRWLLHTRIQEDAQLILLGFGILMSIATLALVSIAFKWLAHGKFRIVSAAVLFLLSLFLLFNCVAHCFVLNRKDRLLCQYVRLLLSFACAGVGYVLLAGPPKDPSSEQTLLCMCLHS
jgi:hypothetical protein